jgi:hypothetical protein
VEQAQQAPGTQVRTGQHQRKPVPAGQAQPQRVPVRAAAVPAAVVSPAGRSTSAARQASARPQLKLQQQRCLAAAGSSSQGQDSCASHSWCQQQRSGCSNDASACCSSHMAHHTSGAAQPGVRTERQSRLPSAGTTSVKRLVAGWVQRSSR